MFAQISIATTFVFALVMMSSFVTADRTLDECRRKQSESRQYAYTVPIYTDCTKYAQCSASGQSYIDRPCPPGLFFAYNSTLGGGACQHAYMVQCDADPCKVAGVSKHGDRQNCNYYYVCILRRSFLRNCLPSHRYNNGSCVRDANCAPPNTTPTTGR